MARIIFPSGEQETDFDNIQSILSKLGVALRHWPLPSDAENQALLEAKSLDDTQKEKLLGALEPYFQQLQEEQGYTTRDMIVLHEDIPGLGDMLAKFDSIHYHTDDEVRYVIAGKGYFGFVDPDDGQFLVEVSSGDYINVPANAEHWFTLGDSSRIKAVRYFIDTEGWTPVYTEREMKFNDSNLPWAQ